MTGAKPKRCAIYVRCSTQDQNPEMQRLDLNEFAAARGWEVHHVYEDQKTGTTANRTGLQVMLTDARAGRFQVLACWKLDRVFRSFAEMVATLQLLGELGIEFVSLKDPGIDMTTSSGRLLTHILSAFAEFEGSLIRERVRAGVQAKIKKTGGAWGRRKTRDDDKIAALKSKGHSNRAVAKELGLSEATVRRSLAGASITRLKSPRK